MDGTPTPGHWIRLPYHWGSGSHFAGTAGDRYADAMLERYELRLSIPRLSTVTNVTGRLAPEGTFRDNQREYINESACDGALSLARTARAPSSGRPSPFL